MEREIRNRSCLEKLVLVPCWEEICLKLISFKQLLLFGLDSFPKVFLLELLGMRLHVLRSSVGEVFVCLLSECLCAFDIESLEV